ncbi:MAG: adenylate/guanylate cyclase domain-containing protein [Calditrichaceae bacterium]|nr:adenylate/guanylate cyclase domain-containing protein [Calditrichaceae bacterium]MBN2707503.1 adenylate/guanylate cyclase domain-containing protein [Calditrichaceae bacterium]RQV95594.1 MAG: adenylate/guanylate cyclase domain-containing protein [Calditrichota bacterium]
MKKHLIKIVSGALLGIAAALIIWVMSNYLAKDLFYTYEAKTYDWRVPQKFVDDLTVEDIVIVDIDATSLNVLGKYSQWQREYHTKVVKFLSESGALAIGLDILYDPEIWHPEQDETFIKQIEQSGNVFNALYFADADSDFFRYVMDKEPDSLDINRFSWKLEPEDMRIYKEEDRFENEFVDLLNAGAGAGHVNFNADVDGIVRSIHLFARFNDRLYPSLSFSMFTALIGVDKIDISDDYINLFRGEEKLTGIPIDKNGNMLINYAGDFKTFRYISFSDVLNHQERGLDSTYFENKVVLIGTSLPGLFDLRSVPFQQAFPGVEIHANILYTLMQQNFIHKADPLLSLILLIALGMILGILLSYTKPVVSFIIIIILSVAEVGLAGHLYAHNSLWIQIINPILTIFLTFTFVYIYRYITEEKDKRFIRTTFSHFVTKSVVDELLAHPEKIKLGGEKKVCTVLFSDVAGFTTISEQLSPEALVHLLNEYLTEMTNLVFKHDGMLDKYEGDAIMAVFGAPIELGNHAYNACNAALIMQIQLEKMREIWREAGKPELHARIGINTGPMVVGNMGSETRFDYTVMGDSVNLGARLEPANKEYGTNIIIGEETYKQAGNSLVVRPLDLLRVKGKTEPVQVYELIGTDIYRPDEESLKILEFFQKGYDNYLNRNWEFAVKYFQEALRLRAKDGPSRRYLKRCEYFMQNPPAEDWDGVYTMTTK